MFSVSIKVDDANTKKLLKSLGKDAPKVMADAQNRAAAGVRTDGTRLIKKESGIERKRIFNAFNITKANAKSDAPLARVVVSGRPVGFSKFPHKPKRLMNGKTKNGVKINAAGKNIHFRHAFVAQMPNGHIGIFERIRGKKTRSGKTAIHEFFGPSIPQIAGRKNIEKQILSGANERFSTRFEQQSARYFKKMGVK